MPRSSSPLSEYRRKRDFSKTAEPAGDARPRARRGPLRFIVQKHAATRLHFDLRLELDGVMKSWAVPKGPSLDPAERRLAMEVEDHPIEYNRFEGIIPKGEYGGGTVMLWDRGTYAPNGDDARDGIDAVRRGYRAGRLKVFFHGHRLQGGWTLVRMRGRDADADKPAWLLIKERDEHADPARDLVAEEVTSVATRRTMEQIASGRSRRWTRAGGAEPARGVSTSRPAATGAAAKRSATQRAPAKRAPAKRAPAKRAPAKRGTKRSAKRSAGKRQAAKPRSGPRT